MLPYADAYRVTARVKTSEKKEAFNSIIESIIQSSDDSIHFRTKSGVSIDNITDIANSAGVEILGINKVKQSLEKAFTEIIREEESAK